MEESMSVESLPVSVGWGSVGAVSLGAAGPVSFSFSMQADNAKLNHKRHMNASHRNQSHCSIVFSINFPDIMGFCDQAHLAARAWLLSKKAPAHLAAGNGEILSNKSRTAAGHSMAS